jgi:transposase
VGLTRGGKATVVPTRGHSKDHRPDLKLLLFILTVIGDGAVPVAHCVSHVNTEDSITHVATWDSLCALFDTKGFLYAADSKLATRENMDHIASRGGGGGFVSVLPRTRKGD